MEMGNKQICSLCLEIVPPGDAEAIGEKKKEILAVLLINVDPHIMGNAVACSRCMEEALSGFEFKSACFRVDNYISTSADSGVPVDMKKIFQEVMRGTAMANVDLYNRQVCRLCMSLIEDEALDCNTDLRDIIANCLPEVDIHKVHEPLVCELCFSRMTKLNQFMTTCQEIEQRINNYLQVGVDHAIPLSLNLDDLKFKDNTIDGFIKEESLNFRNNILKEPKKEDIGNIECEEIHIKDELDSGDEMVDSVPLGAYNNSGNSGSLKRERQIGQFTSKERKHYFSDSHMVRQRGLNKEFACQECTYKTNRKAILTQHMFRHKDKSEVKMHKCDICVYETRYKGNMIQHMLRHRDPKAERKFKCDKCPYDTDIKCRLRMHNLIHKDKSEVEMRKCEICEYETKYKGTMNQHMLRHRDPRAERKFKCDKCTYETDFKTSLCKHNLIHMNKSEVVMHKCYNCEFETMYKNSMISHMLKHRNTEAKKLERKFKCDECPYETNYKSHLGRHNIVHKNKSEVKMHKCDNCEYETRRKDSMIRHMQSHRDPKAQRKLKCDKCPYETNDKSHLCRHNLIHKNKSEVEMHKCEYCEFETRRKDNMKQHMKTHRDPKGEKKFKCDKCTYETDFRHNLPS